MIASINIPERIETPEQLTAAEARLGKIMDDDADMVGKKWADWILIRAVIDEYEKGKAARKLLESIGYPLENMT